MLEPYEFDTIEEYEEYTKCIQEQGNKIFNTETK